MKTIEINGAKRANISKQEVKSLRGSEMVPCVLYGGEEQVHFSTDLSSFKGLVYTPDVHMVKLSVDGKEYQCVIQDVQYHPVTDVIIHADFLQVFDNKPVTMSIPVKLTGASEGVKMGGKLVTKYRRLKVKALPANLPDFISVDISPMKIGDSIRVRDLNLSEVTLLESPANVIVSVNMTRNVSAEAAEAAKK
ncbi:MAG: 50S ribosomal protein L25/general stress protein Ctc [Bacteroidota bacterium]|jgi:large subunit ribosomal protein L25